MEVGERQKRWLNFLLTYDNLRTKDFKHTFFGFEVNFKINQGGSKSNQIDSKCYILSEFVYIKSNEKIIKISTNQ